MSQINEKDNFKPIMAGMFAAAMLLGVATTSASNATSYSVIDGSPGLVAQVDKLGNNAVSSVVGNLSDESKNDLAKKLLSNASDEVQKLHTKTITTMSNFPESKNPLDLDGYVSNVFDAVTNNTQTNNIKSVTDDTSEYDIELVRFIVALQAETTASTIDNIQISKDNNAKETALGVLFGNMTLTKATNIRNAITDVVNLELNKNSDSQLTNLTNMTLVDMFNNENTSVERNVLPQPSIATKI